MKKGTTHFLGSILFSLIITGTLYSQPTIDGSFDGTGTWGEPIATADGTDGWSGVNVDSLFITYDDTYYYFSAAITVADWQSWGFAINTTDGGGSSEVWTYPITFGHSNLPDFVIKGHFGQGGATYAEVREWNGATWIQQGGAALGTSEYSSDDVNDFVEVRITKANLGDPDYIQAQFYVTGNNSGEHATFDAVPDDENADAWNDATTLDNFSDILATRSISGSAGWRLLSIPKTGATSADISDDGIGAQFTTSTDSATIYTYDDTGAFEAISSDASALTDGFGLAVYFFDNTTNGSTELPITLDVVGSEPSSDVSLTLNSGVLESLSYFTLVGNPFASNYDLNELDFGAGGAIQNNVHFLDEGVYSSIDRTSSIIPAWQGFWVEGTTALVTTLNFPASGKTSSDTTDSYFEKSVNNRGDINFSLTSENTKDNGIKLSFRDDASIDWDLDDATKLTPLVSQYATLAFKSDNRLKSVESLPWDLSEEIKIDMEEAFVGVNGELTLSWRGLESIPADWKLTFHDYEAGINIDMIEMEKYTFEASSEKVEKVNPLSVLNGPAAIAQKSKSAGSRFGITITPNTTSVNNEEPGKVESFALDQNYPNPFNPTTTINYSVENTGAVTLSVYNLMGQKVAELVNETKSAGSYNVSWNASQAASGMYYYRLEAGGQTLTRKMTLIK